MVEHVFLDAAQTLLHKSDLLPTIVRVLDGYGIAVDENLLVRRHKLLTESTSVPNQTSREHYLEFNRQLLISLEVTPCVTITQAIYGACHALEWVAYSDVDSLCDLTGPFGVISNWDSTLRDKLRSLIPVNFAPVIVSSEVGHRKPSPEIFRLACAELDCDPSRTVHVGDSLRLDVEPALKAGMHAVLLDRDNLYPDYSGLRIQSLNQLAKTIAKV